MAEERIKKAEMKVRVAAPKITSQKAEITTRETNRRNEVSTQFAIQADLLKIVMHMLVLYALQTYGDDALGSSREDWLQCTSRKWVHEECCAANHNRNPRLCHSCIEQFM